MAARFAGADGAAPRAAVTKRIRKRCMFVLIVGPSRSVGPPPMETHSVSIAAMAIGAIQLKQPTKVTPRWQKPLGDKPLALHFAGAWHHPWSAISGALSASRGRDQSQWALQLRFSRSLRQQSSQPFRQGQSPRVPIISSTRVSTACRIETRSDIQQKYASLAHGARRPESATGSSLRRWSHRWCPPFAPRGWMSSRPCDRNNSGSDAVVSG